jgi:hypothetical protein
MIFPLAPLNEPELWDRSDGDAAFQRLRQRR